MGTTGDVKPSRIYFQGFTLDLQRRGLYRGAERIHLTSKPLEALIFLVENRGRVVEKRELLDAVWKDTFVTEDTLVHAVREIRLALEDDKDDPRCVQTVPRQGYRFIASVSEIEAPIREATPPHRPVTQTAVPPSPGRWKPAWYEIALVALIIAIVGAALLWTRLPSQQSIKRPEAVKGNTPARMKELKLLTQGITSAVKPAFSPDGKFILYVSSDLDSQGEQDIYIRPVVEGNPIRITDRINASGDMPTFTADGNYVVFSKFRSGKEGSVPDLWIVPISGGTPKLYIPEAIGAGFSPDGRWVSYTKYLSSRMVLWISSVDRLEEHREIAVHGFTPRWSPDGKWIAFSTSNPNARSGFLWIVSASLGERRQLTTKPEQIYGLTWTPESRFIIYASRDAGPDHLLKVSISGGAVEHLASGVGEYLSPSTSPDGRTLIFAYLRPAIDLVMATDPENPKAENITEGEFHYWPALSPSGRQLATVIRQTGFDEYAYVVDLQTRKRTQLSDRPARAPCWIDEDHIAYLADDLSSGSTEIRIANIATGVNRFAARFSETANWLAAHTDAKLVALVLKTAGKQRVLVRNLETGEERVLAEGSDYHYLQWLPDGTALSWSGLEMAAEPRSSGIWLARLDGSRPRQILQDGYRPVWSTDGGSVYFSRVDKYSGLWRYHLPSKTLAKVRTWTNVFHYDIRGKRLVYAQASGRSQIFSMSLKD